ncbi:MAG: hypothetical protein KAU07_00395 [Candidatus Andersenbacteria bacterium]|nr:hypothetical protein [Candidatus Andersenbacteria bacterium]
MEDENKINDQESLENKISQESGQEETLESVIAKKNSEEGETIGKLLKTGEDINESIEENSKDILPEEAKKFKRQEQEIEGQAEKAQKKYETEISVLSNGSGEKNDSQEDLDKEKTESRQGKENEYDELVPKEELAGFRKEIEKKIEDRANELDISKEKLIELADLDLESLDAENLKDLNCGSLEFIRDSIDEAINEFQKGEKPKTVLKEAPSKIDKLLEFTREHKKIVNLGQLALYFSSFGIPALSVLAEDDAKLEIDGQRIPLKDLADNPELIKEIDVAQIDSETGQIKEMFLPEEQHDDEKGYELAYSKELTMAYDKVPEANEEEHEFKNLEASIELAEELFKYPEMIKNSEKIFLDDFIKKLAKEEFDNLIIGEWHGFGPTEQEAARIIEELIKNNRNISAICLEGLSFDDPKDIEVTKKFNEGKISTDETFKLMVARDSLLKTAIDNSIEIVGVETTKEETVMGYKDKAYYDRFKSISEKVGEITEEKGEDGIVVTYIGQGHVTIDSWKNDNTLNELRKNKPAYPQEKEALEGNYTIKEYLEKRGFDPIALQVEDREKLTGAVDSSLAQRFRNLPEEDRAEFYDFSVEKWKNYVLEENEVFVTEYPDGEKNTFSVVIPSEIPKTPPILNGYKTIYDNPYLAKILDYEKISKDYGENIKFSIQINGERVPIIEIDKTTGELIKMYLPEQAKDFQKDIKDRVFSWEKLKEILTEYDPRQYERDHEIEGNEKLREQDENIEFTREEKTRNIKKGLENAKDKLKKIYARQDSENE